MNHRPFLTGLALSALLLPSPIFAADGSSDDERAEMHAKLAGLVEQMLDDVANEVSYECNCGEREEGEACPTTKKPSAKLVGMFNYGEDVIAAFEPIAVGVVKSKKTTDAQSQAFIGMLLESRNPAVAPVAEAMFDAAPNRFCCDSLLGFCEMGSKPLMEPLAARVKKGKAGVTSAAFLALKGDKVGRKVLKKAVSAKDVGVENAMDVLVAGYALEKLGQTGALYKAQLKVHDATIAALDADEIDTARALAITASVAGDATHTSKPYFSLMGLQCHKALSKAEAHGKLATADEIFELIQEVTPIG